MFQVRLGNNRYLQGEKLEYCEFMGLTQVEESLVDTIYGHWESRSEDKEG